ncbi:MAG: hypothetical protein ACYCTF_10865 [Acidiferrobacter sp.]
MKGQWRFQGAALALATGLMALVSVSAQADLSAPARYDVLPGGARHSVFGAATLGRVIFAPAGPYLADDHEEERQRYGDERRYREREGGDRPRYYAPFFFGAPEGDRGNYGDRGPRGDRGNYGDRPPSYEERR